MPQVSTKQIQRAAAAAPQAKTATTAQATGELQALEARRSELRSQLLSLTQRRALLQAQLAQSDGPQRAGLRDRIAALDDRTGRIDDELNAIDDQVNAALAGRGTRVPSSFDPLIQRGRQTITMPMPPFMPGFSNRKIDTLYNVVAAEGIGIVLLGFVLWRTWRRRGPATAGRLAPEDSGRIDALQRAVDVIAVEVERISEGQRYVNKVLSENQIAVGPGAAQEIRDHHKDAVRSKLSTD